MQAMHTSIVTTIHCTCFHVTRKSALFCTSVSLTHTPFPPSLLHFFVCCLSTCKELPIIIIISPHIPSPPPPPLLLSLRRVCSDFQQGASNFFYSISKLHFAIIVLFIHSSPCGRDTPLSDPFPRFLLPSFPVKG